MLKTTNQAVFASAKRLNQIVRPSPGMIGRGFVAALVMALFAGLACSVAHAEEKSGAIQLSVSKVGPPANATEIDMGQAIKLTAKPYITDFFGSQVITAGASVKNTGKRPMFFAFHIAFFDKDDHLLGCTSQTSLGDDGLKPGEETQLGSCLVQMTDMALKRVVRYQAAFYVTPKKM